MSERNSIRMNCIDVKRNYPSIDIYYGDEEGVLKGLFVPRYLYLLKFNSNFRIVFSKHQRSKIHLIEQSYFQEDFDILFDSYSDGEYTPHSIRPQFFALLNKLIPTHHYSSELIRTYRYKEEAHYLAMVDQWGGDLVELVNRASCNFVASRYFENSIELLTDKDIEKHGVELIEMISDVAFLVAPAEVDAKLRILSVQVQCYGRELVTFVLETCEKYYSSLRLRFCEATFISHLNGASHYFMTYYRNIY